MTRRPSAASRRGFSMIAVLALFALAGSLFVVWTRGALLQQHQTRRLHERAQAEQLATAALSRAASQLATDADYQGEEWRLSAEQLHQPYEARVTITLEDQDDQMVATAVVELPPGESRRVRLTRSTPIPNPSAGDS